MHILKVTYKEITMDSEHDFIAEREWDYRVNTNKIIKVRVGFRKPAKVTDELWKSEFLIFWPDGKIIVRATRGCDPVDALMSVISLFRIECEKLKEALGDKITFSTSSSLSEYIR
jgi:hypothetical protein